MKTSKLVSISLLAALFIGCGSSDNNNNSAVDVPIEEEESYTSTSMQVNQRDAAYMVDAEGKTLYTFDNDTLGISNCVDGCLDIWPIFSVEGLSEARDDFGGLEANASHTAFQNHPLYYFHLDANVSDTLGDWVNNVWHVVYPPASYTEDDAALLSLDQMTQNYLTDGNGRSFYTFDKDEPNKSNCTDEVIDGQPSCLSIWPVAYIDVATTALPRGVAPEDLGVITRADGLKQTTYKEKPIYYFHTDSTSGDVNGDWVKGVWHLVEINPAILRGAERFVQGCNSCHGDDGRTPALGVSQIIADINDAQEVKTLLLALRDGPNSDKNAAMVNVAQGLSDDEINILSAYIATLP